MDMKEIVADAERLPERMLSSRIPIGQASDFITHQNLHSAPTLSSHAFAGFRPYAGHPEATAVSSTSADVPPVNV